MSAARAYILDGNKRPVACASDAEWLRGFIADRLVARTEVWLGIIVLTVFTGYGIGRDGNGNPLLWETEVAGGPCDEWREVYATHADAVAGHARMETIVRDAQLRKAGR